MHPIHPLQVPPSFPQEIALQASNGHATMQNANKNQSPIRKKVWIPSTAHDIKATPSKTLTHPSPIFDIPHHRKCSGVIPYINPLPPLLGVAQCSRCQP